MNRDTAQAMTEENLETLRRGHDAFNRGELATVRTTIADEVEWGTTGVFPGARGTYKGATGMEEWTEAVRSAWEWFEVSVDEVLLDEGDVILVAERLVGRGRGSGVEVEMTTYAIYQFQNGKITSRKAFAERSEALKAAEMLE